MRELSLNILDIVENSVRAGATLIKVSVIAKDGFLTIEIKRILLEDAALKI